MIKYGMRDDVLPSPPYRMSYITLAQRSQLQVLVKLGKKQVEIAKLIGISQSTVSRELRRVSGRYRATDAQHDAEAKRYYSYRIRVPWFKRDPKLLEHMLTELRKRRSPEQIVGDLRRRRKSSVSAKTFYTYIWEREYLYRHLRRKGQRHWPGCGTMDTTTIPHRKDISERPKSVETKRRYGDWESDLIIGKDRKGAIATFVERKSRFCQAVLLTDQSARSFRLAAQKVFRPFPLQLRRTMTHDNGKEIVQHRKITKALKIDVYCATPYHSWERGLNENTNGLIRDYYPKGTDFTKLTQKRLDCVLESINTRPRHCLGFRTPEMVFRGVMKRYAFHTSE